MNICRTNTLAVLLMALGFSGAFAFQIPITVQEMLIYTDSLAATNRIAGPVSVGLPLADSMGIASVDQLGLSGTPVGQFRVLQRWGSGNIKWVLCDFQADVSAKTKNNSIALTNGSGNFGGADLAMLTDSTININTGVAQFRVRLHKFNLIDYASVGGHELVSPGKSRGIVLKGAYGGDQRLFMSSLDSLDDVHIEENGPARACIYARGVHRAADGARHFNYLVRMHFYKGKSDVAVYYTLANASRYEKANGWTEWVHLEVPVNVTGNKGFKFSGHDGEVSGTVSGSGASLYQGRSSYPIWKDDWPWYQAPYDSIGGGPTPDTGYKIVNGGVSVKQGARDQYAFRFYGDVSGVDGYGLTSAIEYAAGWWPKSIDVDSSGVLSIGVYPKENSFHFYKFNFSTHNTNRLLLSFHASGADANKACAMFQYPLIAKAPVDWYNQSNALFEKMVTFTQEDSFFTALFGRTYNPYDVLGLGGYSTLTSLSTTIYRMFYTGDGGMYNQYCFSRQGLYNFLREDRITWAGTYYNYAVQRIHYMNDWAMFRADDFKVNRFEAPQMFGDAGSGYTWEGYVDDTNYSGCAKCNYDGEHKLWYGSSLLYQMNGDSRVMEAIKDFGNYEINMDLQRWWGWDRGGSNHLYTLTELFNITGDSVYYDSLISRFKWDMLNTDIHPSANPNIPGPLSGNGGMWWDRGVYIATSALDTATANEAFMNGWYVSSLFIKNYRYRAMLYAYHSVAFDDPIKDEFRDMLNGFGHFIEKELYFNFTVSRNDDALSGPVGYPYAYRLLQAPDTSVKNSNGYPMPEVNESGYRYGLNLREDYYVQTVNNQLWEDTLATGSWWYWECRLFERPPGSGGSYTFKHYPGMMYSIHQQIHPERNFVWRPFNVDAQDQGNGSWKLSWNVPDNATWYQIKYSDKAIVEWLNFDRYSRQYEFDPAQYVSFYHAKNITGEPQPGPAGSGQEMTVTGLTPGQAFHFSAKFYNGPSGSGTTGLDGRCAGADGDFDLNVFPNPCNPEAAIRFRLPSRQKIEVLIYDLGGRKIKTLQMGEMKAGAHRLEWTGKSENGRSVASGVYVLKVRGAKQTVNKKIVILK